MKTFSSRQGLHSNTSRMLSSSCLMVIISMCKFGVAIATMRMPMISNPLDKVVFSNKCMDELGCFYTGPPYFHPLRRPVSLAPFDRSDMKTTFWLFTPQNKEQAYELRLTPESLNDSCFDEKLPIKFIIHGYTSKLTEDDSRHRMKDAFLSTGNYNVIIVDWTKSNGRPYAQAVANARVVGAELAQMIQFLEQERGIDSKSAHLIGHSLGSHVAGWAGHRTPNLSRITGLDPAGPYFMKSDDEISLDKTDAEFVDIIHSNTGDIGIFQTNIGLGIEDPIGHMDFYPNGGQHQPGCIPTLINVTIAGINITATGDGEGFTSLMATACDHNMATEYFIASITANENCTFRAVPCDDYQHFLDDDCNSTQNAAVMGIAAKEPEETLKGQKLFLKTGRSFPYCADD